MLGSVRADRHLLAALGAVAGISLAGKVAAGVLIAAVVADRPAVCVVDALFEHHFLSHGRIVLLPGQVALIQHFAQNVQLTVAVSGSAVPLLALVHIHALGIGVEQGRVIGDTDETGALGGGQVPQLLAEIFRRGTLDAVAAPPQINLVEVILHDKVFVVFPLENLRPENLHDLSLNGDAFFTGVVLDELLGDGGAAELLVAAEEHIQAGLHGGDPVHTLMLIEPLILDGHGGVDQVFGNFINGRPLAVGGGINLLQQLDIAMVVHIIDKGGLLQVIIVQRPVGGLCQNVLLQIVSQGADEDRTADQHDQKNRRRRAEGNFQHGTGYGENHIQQLQRPVGIPLLPELLAPPGSFFVCHRVPPIEAGRACLVNPL